MFLAAQPKPHSVHREIYSCVLEILPTSYAYDACFSVALCGLCLSVFLACGDYFQVGVRTLSRRLRDDLFVYSVSSCAASQHLMTLEQVVFYLKVSGRSCMHGWESVAGPLAAFFTEYYKWDGWRWAHMPTTWNGQDQDSHES